jgi:hypothetical protein
MSLTGKARTRRRFACGRRPTGDAWRIDHIGISALGEVVGWALPDRFAPRNNRTSKALYALAFAVSVHGS